MLKLNLAEAVSDIKKNWLNVFQPSEILEVCRDQKLRWRKRVLDPVTTIQLLLLQILHGNTAITHLRFFASRPFSASAYCQARKRIPVSVLKALLTKMTAGIRREVGERWHGRRVLLVDGSNFSMSDTPALQEHFGQPTGQKQGCGFPIAHFLALMHAASGLIQEILPGALFSHDLTRFILLHPSLKRRDLIVADRAFCSFSHIALLVARQVDAVFRMHQAANVNFCTGRKHLRGKKGKRGAPRSRWEKKLGITDQLVTWFKPDHLPLSISETQFRTLPEELLLREVSYLVKRPGFRVRQVVLVTTLLDPEEFPKEVLTDLYQQRWRIETNFNHLKTTMRMEVLHCRTVAGTLRELYAFCIIYNAVCAIIMHNAALRDCPAQRLSFIDALRWLLSACHHKPRAALMLVPLRPGRYEPRVKKRRAKPYDLLNKPRHCYSLANAYA